MIIVHCKKRMDFKEAGRVNRSVSCLRLASLTAVLFHSLREEKPLDVDIPFIYNCCHIVQDVEYIQFYISVSNFLPFTSGFIHDFSFLFEPLQATRQQIMEHPKIRSFWSCPWV